MNDMKDLTFECPHCGHTHDKKMDANVLFAEMNYWCDKSEGGCNTLFFLRFTGEGGVEARKLTMDESHWASWMRDYLNPKHTKKK